MQIDQERREQLQELLRIHRLRLFELEKQQAFTGSSTPPHINIEINDIKKKIEDIKQELTTLEIPITVVEIRIKGNISALNDSILDATIRAVAGIMQVSTNQVRFIGAMEGSIILLLVAPRAAAVSLLEAFKKNTISAELGIESVDVITVQCKNLDSTKDIDEDIRRLSTEIGRAENRINNSGDVKVYSLILIILSFFFSRGLLYASIFNFTMGVFSSLIVVLFSYWFAGYRKKTATKDMREKRAELLACYGEVMPLWNKIEEAKRAAQRELEKARIAQRKAEEEKKKAEMKAKEEVRTKSPLFFLVAGSNHPHVIGSASQGQWTPEPGYIWVNPVDDTNLNVVWSPGRQHSEYPNLVASDTEGKWNDTRKVPEMVERRQLPPLERIRREQRGREDGREMEDGRG